MHPTFTDQSLIYLQIAQMIEDNILRTIYHEEEQVASTNELAKLYAINPATAAKGLNLLVGEGILYKKRGVGMFVATGAVNLIKSKRKAAFYENFVKPLAKEYQTLELSQQQLIDMVQQAMSERE